MGKLLECYQSDRKSQTSSLEYKSKTANIPSTDNSKKLKDLQKQIPEYTPATIEELDDEDYYNSA